jgi:hypothetical protein
MLSNGFTPYKFVMTQVVTTLSDASDFLSEFLELVSGFQGSATLNTKLNFGQNALYKWGHIATTYSALATLVILGDDLERIHRASIIRSR